jgi:glycosyltransferase involved in cell wall biosynthesis
MTVVMPNYNDSEFIGRAIESVLGQDYPRLEFIIVDDGSTDGSVELIRSYGDAIRLICHEKNKGHAAAVNTGLRLVQGEILNWLNSNDSYVPGVLPKIGRYFLRHPGTNVIFGDFNVIDIDDRVLLRQRVLPLDYAYACMVGFGSLIAVSTMFMRKHVLDTAGLLDETYHHVPDNDFIFRVAQNFPIRKLSMRIANWRHHPTSITRRGTTTVWDAHTADVDRAIKTSYNTLAISHLIPYERSGGLRAVYKIKRVFQRILRLHYLAYIPIWLEAGKQRFSSIFRRQSRNDGSSST